MLANQNESKSTAYIVLSCLIHGALALGVGYYASDHLELRQSGSADTVEFEMDVTQGEQTEVDEWAPEEIKTESSEELAAVAPPPPPEPSTPKPKVEAKPQVEAPAPKKPVAAAKPEVKTSPEPVKAPEPTKVASTAKDFDGLVAAEVASDSSPEELGVEKVPAPLPEQESLAPVSNTGLENTFDEASKEDLTAVEGIDSEHLDSEEVDPSEKVVASPKWVPSENFSAEPAEPAQEELADSRSAQVTAAPAQESRRTSMQTPGVPEGVRDYRSLSQRPGNVIPSYDKEDRLRRREGTVSFLAYVSPNGNLTDFRMKRSSGHRSLDYKALQAVKQWRFLAGQEGWVEIPIVWKLKGEAIEIGSPLRASTN